MTTRFKLVFEPLGDHVHVRVFATTTGTLGLCGSLTFRREEWVQFAGALEMGAAFIEARPEVEIEPKREPRLGCCSLCGSGRIALADGGWGACGLLGCTDPMFDLKRERAMREMAAETEAR
jgi:hypothetical protein